jgi:hypothetical protein
MTYVVQFGFLFYVCGVASYWMINLFTSTYKLKEKRIKTKIGFDHSHLKFQKLGGKIRKT